MKFLYLLTLSLFVFQCAEKKYCIECDNLNHFELLPGKITKENVCGKYTFYDCTDYFRTSQVEASHMDLGCGDSATIKIYNFPKVFVEYDLTKDVLDTLFSFYGCGEGFFFKEEFYPGVDFFNYKKYNPTIIKGANSSRRFNIMRIEMDTMLIMYDSKCNYIIYKKEK